MSTTAEPMTQTEAAPTELPFSDVAPGAVLEVSDNGLIVSAEHLLQLAQHLRDHEGYDYLSMVTSVDWPELF